MAESLSMNGFVDGRQGWEFVHFYAFIEGHLEEPLVGVSAIPRQQTNATFVKILEKACMILGKLCFCRLAWMRGARMMDHKSSSTWDKRINIRFVTLATVLGELSDLSSVLITLEMRWRRCW